MKINSIIKKASAIVLLSDLVAGTVGCSSTKKEATDSGVKKVVIGIRQDLYPTSYIDENGKPSGYDIEIAKKIDELLPDYEFEYEAVSQEALLTGLDTGKYVAAIAGFYSNPDREAKYLFPKEPIGGNIIGLAVRSEDSSIKNLDDLHNSGKKLEPIAPTSGMYGIVTDYNKQNPSKAFEIPTSEWTDAADLYKWIADGTYDAAVTSKNVFDDTAPKLGLNDKLVFNSFTAIKTWSLFNKDQIELAAAYDKALKELKDNGTVSDLSVKYFGEDVLPYIQK